MQFRFTRDEEGTERIHVGEVCIARIPDNRWRFKWEMMAHVEGVTHDNVDAAIERADEAGFWSPICGGVDESWRLAEVTVDVPVPETTATLTLVSDGEGQS